mmetsp:Transcript_41549/g.109419  ORF Transcript_41549/g.109419 Transcript_41549/m.109419 type:complete len:237 (+) Transcript_41549:3157-3867(+)
MQVVDCGDVGLNPFSIEKAVKHMEEEASKVLEASRSKRMLTIGGDHTISLPILRAIRKVHGPVALVHFDAHLDTWDTYFDEPTTHGTPFRRAWEEGLLLEKKSIHIGTRGPIYAKQDIVEDEGFGFRIIRSEDVQELGVQKVVSRIKERVGDAPVYLSIDIDVLDPCHAPGTGTPEPGGLTSRELLMMLRGLVDINLVSADVMEVAPAYDHAELTTLAASSLCYELLSMMCKRSAR